MLSFRNYLQIFISVTYLLWHATHGVMDRSSHIFAYLSLDIQRISVFFFFFYNRAFELLVQNLCQCLFFGLKQKSSTVIVNWFPEKFSKLMENFISIDW